jgi:hypothetical protein
VWRYEGKQPAHDFLRQNVLCGPVATRRIGAASRTQNAPSLTSTSDPAHHRATKAAADVASRKYLGQKRAQPAGWPAQLDPAREAALGLGDHEL